MWVYNPNAAMLYVMSGWLVVTAGNSWWWLWCDEHDSQSDVIVLRTRNADVERSQRYHVAICIWGRYFSASVPVTSTRLLPLPRWRLCFCLCWFVCQPDISK